MGELKEWMWLIKTNKGDFFIIVTGNWTQEEAAEKVRMVFESLKLCIIGMIPRKRATGPNGMTGTILEQQETKDAQGFDFLAGKKFWQIAGRVAEYDAEMILLNGSLKEASEINDGKVF